MSPNAGSSRIGPLFKNAGPYVVMLSSIVGTSVYEFTWTIAGVALPHMQGAFSATPDEIAWVMTAFIMGSTVMIAISGWLSIRFGRRRMFLASIAGFTASLIMCALATTLFEEAIWRFVQGFLGGALIPLGKAITVDAFPREKRGEAIALWGIGLVASAVLGPVIGGVVVEFYDWPWIFYLNVPVGIVAYVVAWAIVPETEIKPDHRLDWLGCSALIIGVVTLQLLLNRGERLDWFGSPEIIIESVLAGIAFYIFVVHSATTERPFLEPRLFRDKNFQLGLIFGFINGAIVTLPLVLLPLLLQTLAAYPVIDAGTLMLARGFGVMFGMLVLSRLITRLDPRHILAVGFMCVAASSWAMSGWTLDVLAFDVIWTNFVQGVGSGIMFVPITTLAFTTLSRRHTTEGFSVFFLVFFTGTTVGFAVIFAVLTRTAQISHAVLSEYVNPYNELFRYSFIRELWNPAEANGLAALDAEITRQATMIAYNNSFYATALVSLAMLPLIFLFRTQDAAQQKQTE